MGEVIKLFPGKEKVEEKHEPSPREFNICEVRVDLLTNAYLKFCHMDQNRELAMRALFALMNSTPGSRYVQVDEVLADAVRDVNALELLDWLTEGEDE